MLQRYLDDLETSWIGKWPMGAAKFNGSIDPEILRQAFTMLCNHYPVLRARIRCDQEGCLLFVPPNSQPEFLILKGGVRALRRERNYSLDVAHGVARLILAKTDAGGYVALQSSHALTDARAFTEMFRALWRLYTDLISGSNTSIQSAGPLPQSCHDLLKQRWGELQSAPPAGAAQGSRLTTVREARDVQPTDEQTSSPDTHRICLNRKDTRQIVDAARSLHTSVHALICGALLSEMRRLDTRKGSVPAVCLTLVDLRDRVTPPVGSTETTNFAFHHIAELALTEDADPIMVGREVKSQLDASIASGNLLRPASVMRRQVPQEFGDGGGVSVGITNAGVVPEFVQPDGLKITDFFWVEQSAALLANRIPGRGSAHVVQTYRGRLSISGTYAGYSFTSKELLERTSSNLLKVTDQAV